MANNALIVAIEMDPELTLEDICQICQISHEFVLELISYGAIEPKYQLNGNWKFDAQHLRRIRTIVHLQDDLEVNLPGAILALDLREQISGLQSELELLKKYLDTQL